MRWSDVFMNIVQRNEKKMIQRTRFRGVLLAGGNGSRLHPLTKVTNKHLLPIYNEPMIFYPLKNLISMGIKEILIISGTEHCGHILQLLGSGKSFGIDISYRVQDEAGGIAQALSLAERFASGDNIVTVLGDNIFCDKFNEQTLDNYVDGALLFLKKVENASRYGVAETRDGKIINIEEKPKTPKTNLAVTGLYVFDNSVFKIIKQIKPSKRDELEITDVNNIYIKNNKMQYRILQDEWTDAGTHESLFLANQIVRQKYLENME